MGGSPVVPGVYTLTWVGVLIAAAILLVAATVVLAWALVSIARIGSVVAPALTPAWVVLIVLVPIVGPLTWLVSGRSAYRRLS